MDGLRPEDELKADRSDRRASRDDEPQINFDDVDLDTDDGRVARAGKFRRESDEAAFTEDLELTEPSSEPRPRKRKKAPVKPASRQYIMMGIGILVLLLLIAGIGSALKSPPSPASEAPSGERNISPSDNRANVDRSTDSASSQPQDVSLPPVASTPTQSQAAAEPQGQQRIEVQGNLGSALISQQEQLDGAVATSTLPTGPATVAPLRHGNIPRQAGGQQAPMAMEHTPEHRKVVIEDKSYNRPQAAPKAPVAAKSAAQPGHVESAAVRTPEARTNKPAAAASAKPTPVVAAAAGGKTTGDVSAMKSAPSGNYTLQLSSSSNYNNLNNWAKKEKLEKYVVYETTRNGQPWYVLVSGIYASKDEAKRAVTALPAEVQAKNPWAKPLHQVQADLK